MATALLATTTLPPADAPARESVHRLAAALEQPTAKLVAPDGTTVEVPPFEYDLDARTASLSEVSVQLPRSRVSAGSFSLTCNDQLIGTIGVSIEFDAVVSVRSGTLDLDSRVVTLDQPTVSITGAEATFAGAPAGTPPAPLDPITIEIPEFEIQV